MLRETFEDALARGDKLRKDITKEILSASILSDIANNERFVNAVTYVIRSRDNVTRSLQKRFNETMDTMRIATRQQLRTYERRVTRLEKELDAITRKFMRNGSRPKKVKTTAKKSRVTASAKRATASRKPKKRASTIKKAARKKISAAGKRVKRVASKTKKKR